MKHASKSSSFKHQQLSVDVLKSDWGPQPVGNCPAAWQHTWSCSASSPNSTGGLSGLIFSSWTTSESPLSYCTLQPCLLLLSTSAGQYMPAAWSHGRFELVQPDTTLLSSCGDDRFDRLDAAEALDAGVHVLGKHISNHVIFGKRILSAAIAYHCTLSSTCGELAATRCGPARVWGRLWHRGAACTQAAMTKHNNACLGPRQRPKRLL